MRTSQPPLQIGVFVSAVVLTLLASRFVLSAAPTNTAATARSGGFVVQPPFIEPAIPQSTFQQPKKLAEGRNPFFPQSTRHIGVETAPKTNPVPTLTAELALKGISGTAEQPLAIINNMTFTAGEERDVATPAGKIRIRCVEINIAEGTVSVQVGGQIRQLRLSPSK